MKIILIFTTCIIVFPALALAQNVYVLHDQSVPQAVYSAERIGEALEEHGYSVTEERSDYDYLLNVGIN